jgi:hypothetical protein
MCLKRCFYVNKDLVLTRQEYSGDLEYDLGNLMATTYAPVEQDRLKAETRGACLEMATQIAQSLVARLFELPSDAAPVLCLPQASGIVVHGACAWLIPGRVYRVVQEMAFLTNPLRRTGGSHCTPSHTNNATAARKAAAEATRPYKVGTLCTAQGHCEEEAQQGNLG